MLVNKNNLLYISVTMANKRWLELKDLICAEFKVKIEKWITGIIDVM